MSLQMIVGNAGSGKTHYLYDRVIKESLKHPERNYLIIVPEQFTMATQKELVLRHPNGGIMNIDVLSFGRLAYRIFEEVGKTHGSVLDDEGKNLILRKIAGQYESKLRVIGKNMRKFGYISEVKSVISEFTQYDINMEKLQSLRGQLPEHSILSYKLEDIETLYKGFYEYLDGKYITGEELLERLSSVVGESEILRDSVVTFDGFTGFTPVQNRLIKELMKVSSGIYMTITLDENAYQESYEGGEELFALSKETIQNMVQLAATCNQEVKPSVTLFEKPVYRFRKQEPMAFLESQIFRYGNKKYKEKQEVITGHIMRNPEEEARWVAGEIRRLVRMKGYRYQEIAVISSSMEDYGTTLKRACEQYEIPVFSDQKRSILLNSFVEYIRSVLIMIEQNYTYETVFRFLKSGYAILPMEVIDQLESYVLSRGIKGYKKWQEPWIEEVKYLNEDTQNQLNQARVQFVEYIQNLQYVLTNKNKTVEDICRALYEFFVVNKIQERIEHLEQTLQEEGRLSLAKEYGQIYKVVLELFDKFVSLLGDEKVALREFNELFDAGMQEARIGLIPPSIDSVIIGDLTRTRIGNVKVLFFVGANDSHLPGKTGASGFLSERDREWFSKEQIRLKPSSKEQIYIQKFYLYLNMTKPTEHLYITYSKTSSDGKSIRPAYLIGEMKKLFTAFPITEESLGLGGRELTPVLGLDYLIEGLRNVEIQEEPIWKELYLWYKKRPEWEYILQLIKEASQYKKSDDKLTREIAKKLYGEILKNSVTRLEKFASCPYAHFLSYGLRLQEREVYEFEPVDLGNIFHAAIEYYSKKLHKNKIQWNEIGKEEQEAWADEAIEMSVKDYEHALLYKSERDKYHIERMKRLMRRSVWAVSEQLACGKFKPEAFEVAFGEETELDSTRILLEQEQSMILRGKIDRVDTYEENGNTYVKVLDYKTGSKKLSLSELYYGLQLQLFVYLNAAVEIEQGKQQKKGQSQEGRVVPAGALYYRMDDPMVEVSGEEENPKEESQKQTEFIKKIEQGILTELTPDGLVNRAENVVRNLDDSFKMKSFAVPVNRDAKGQIKDSEHVVSEQEFELLQAFTRKKVKRLGNEIVDGTISIQPIKLGKNTGCKYCDYNKICGFDTKIEGYEYTELTEEKKERVLERIEWSLNNED